MARLRTGKRYSLILITTVLVGCAQSPIKQAWVTDNDNFWRNYRQAGVWLEKDGQRWKFIPGSTLTYLMRAKDRIEEQSGVKAHLGIVETDHPNAFSSVHNGKNYVAFSVNFLELFGRDPDAIATTMGHEYAHLGLGHIAQHSDRESTGRAAGVAVGVVASLAGIPMGGTLADLGTTAVISSYSRDEEREADERGLEWAARAGFNPCGQVRVVDALYGLGPGNLPFLSSHPGFKERSEAAERHAIKTTGRRCIPSQ